MRLREIRDSPKTTQITKAEAGTEPGSIALQRQDPWDNIMSLPPPVGGMGYEPSILRAEWKRLHLKEGHLRDTLITTHKKYIL